MNDTHAVGVRADIWLWAARLFKTRGLCRQMIDGGKVELSGAACKPSKVVRPGDILRVSRGHERLELHVLAVADKRGPASVAQTLYCESEASLKARQAQQAMARLQRPVRPDGRPQKGARRALRRLKQQQV